MPLLDSRRPPHVANARRPPAAKRLRRSQETFPSAPVEHRLRLSEAVSLVRSAGWIATLRGLGIGLATVSGALGCTTMGWARGPRLAAGALLATSLILFARGVLRRHAPSGPSLACSSLIWVLLLCMDLPRVLRLGGAFDLASLRAEPFILAVLPAWLLPELFTVYALLRSDGRAVLRASTALPPASLDESPLRMSGRTLAAQGLLVLVLLSSVLLCLFGPGVLLTLA